METQRAFHSPVADVTREDGINGNEDEVVCGLVLVGGDVE